MQVLTLSKKVKAKWGNFSVTDLDDSDDPNWGFVAMKKLGHIAIGIAKEELRHLPIRGIEDVVDVLGREKDWSRGQVRANKDAAARFLKLSAGNFSLKYEALDVHY